MGNKKKELKRKNLIWVDLEMTGLEPEKDVILEIASIVTDDRLEVLGEGPDLVIHYSDAVLDSMNEWCVKQHGKSGLTQAVKESKVSIEEAEERTLEFLKLYFKPDEGVLAGNSVWNDKMFIRQYMPKLYEFLNYRIVDVSTVKELIKRWYPNSAHTDYKKHDGHRALADIRESIEELKHYRNYFFLPEGYASRPEEQ